jgi:hypothetical protein
MPVSSFLELGGGGARIHTPLTTDASEHTRYLRMAATIAPYINRGVSPVPIALGWRDIDRTQSFESAAKGMHLD